MGFSRKNAEMGCHFLLQGIFPTQGTNSGLLHCKQILYQLSHKGSPRIMVWVAYSFSRRSSRPRNQTRVSCIAGGFFTSWATREAWSDLITHRTIIKRTGENFWRWWMSLWHRLCWWWFHGFMPFYLQTHQVVYIKCIELFICQSHLNKVILKWFWGEWVSNTKL